ncbi:hypothetical protein GWK47_015243 [Chionoecetes opilio]|uniref:Uncharacterized protein n=1 Tax=Chionoecetes opilio TaxID=41210 RepID=A0A8J5CKP3_CHIOP|nr:hypothetical protein GWK47_015243 [Chionoecetes opilio]
MVLRVAFLVRAAARRPLVLAAKGGMTTRRHRNTCPTPLCVSCVTDFLIRCSQCSPYRLVEKIRTNQGRAERKGWGGAFTPLWLFGDRKESLLPGRGGSFPHDISNNDPEKKSNSRLSKIWSRSGSRARGVLWCPPASRHALRLTPTRSSSTLSVLTAVHSLAHRGYSVSAHRRASHDASGSVEQTTQRPARGSVTPAVTRVHFNHLIFRPSSVIQD